MEPLELFYIVERTSTDQLHYIAGPFGSYQEAIKGKAQLAKTAYTSSYFVVSQIIEVSE